MRCALSHLPRTARVVTCVSRRSVASGEARLGSTVVMPIAPPRETQDAIAAVVPLATLGHEVSQQAIAADVHPSQSSEDAGHVFRQQFLLGHHVRVASVGGFVRSAINPLALALDFKPCSRPFSTPRLSLASSHRFLSDVVRSRPRSEKSRPRSSATGRQSRRHSAMPSGRLSLDR